MEWVKLNRPLSHETIKKLEEELGINLPRDFIDWYSLYDLPKQQELLVDVDGEPCDIDSFYPIQMMASESKSFFDEDKQLSENGKVLPFAFDSIGSQYCFFYPKNSKAPSTILFHHKDDHDSELFDGDHIDESFTISSTFQGFLDQLYIREED